MAHCGPGKIVDISELDADIQELIAKAKDVRRFAYCPYSKFPVGSAIRIEQGTIYSGCNIENSSFPASICAERAAVCKIVSENKNAKITSVAVVAKLEKTFCTPCGVCRQVLSEFGDGEIPVYMSQPDETKILCTKLNELLPLAFSF